MIRRGGIHWADLGPPVGSGPGKRRPVLVISADVYNQSRITTVLAAALTSSTPMAAMPGNVFLPAAVTGLPRDSVVNVTALVTLNKGDLNDQAGALTGDLMEEVERGLRRVLGLSR